jgi:hypothetical protein
VVPLTGALGAAFFGADATTFGLSRGRPGRADGCYTVLDELFRTSAPSDWMRGFELVLAAALSAAALISILRSLRLRLHVSRPRAA